MPICLFVFIILDMNLIYNVETQLKSFKFKSTIRVKFRMIIMHVNNQVLINDVLIIP